MQVGNARYLTENDLPKTLPVFPLAGALLLPGGQLPLNIFEPRYLAMFDDALSGHRLIGMIQPALDAAEADPKPPLAKVGCIGRITSFGETGDGRYILSLTGVTRFRVLEELAVTTPYRQVKLAPFLTDLDPVDDSAVDRKGLLQAFRDYLDANGLEADWENINRASNATLVTSMSMMSPYGPAEKQALLEAPDLKTRAETLIAITEIALARAAPDGGGILQ
jgi:Lon protease-like protein